MRIADKGYHLEIGRDRCPVVVLGRDLQCVTLFDDSLRIRTLQCVSPGIREQVTQHMLVQVLVTRIASSLGPPDIIFGQSHGQCIQGIGYLDGKIKFDPGGKLTGHRVVRTFRIEVRYGSIMHDPAGSGLPVAPTEAVLVFRT